MHYSAKTDNNQVEIVDALRKAGAKVFPTHRLGGGFPDIFVLFRGVALLMEIKSKGKKLNQEEQDFYHQYQECTVVVYSVNEALLAIGAI